MVLLQSLYPNKSFIRTKTKGNFNYDKQQKIMFNLYTILYYSLSRYYELESLYPLFKNKNLIYRIQLRASTVDYIFSLLR